jgi:hypothetical protein
MIQPGRMTASLPGDFVVFLIGMRINKPLQIHMWLPVARAMPRMLRELYRQPELGFLHAEAWFGRTTILLQYWNSLDQLLAYATNKEAEHLPAWRAFNKAVGISGSVGIWHETYRIAAGNYEVFYGDMPLFGLGGAGTLQPATGYRRTALGRLRGGQP